MTGYEIVSAFERAFSHGKFQAADWMLSGLDPWGMTPEQTISVLSICWHARGALEQLKPFYDRAEEALVDTLGVERAFSLLQMRQP